MKYIIKNCPALLKGAEKWARGYKDDEYLCNDGVKWCKDCPDCILKQIYEKFKECSCELINLLEIEEFDGN